MSSLSAETESKMCKLLLSLADGESNVEVTREVLANQIGFDPYSVFRKLDTEGKGYVDSLNVVEFLKAHSIYISSAEAQQIVASYDSDLNGNLNYSEFLNLIVSRSNYVLRNSALNTSNYNPFNPLPYDVEYSLVRIFEKEIDFARNQTMLVKDLNLRYDFNACDAYRVLDVYSLDNVNNECIRKFLFRNYSDASETDITNMIRRLDVDGDYRVTFSEFRRFAANYGGELVGRVCGLSPCKCSSVCYYTYSPIKRRYMYSPYKCSRYCSKYCTCEVCYTSPIRRRYYSPFRSTYSTYLSPIRNTTTRYESPLKKTQNVLSGNSCSSFGNKSTQFNNNNQSMSMSNTLNSNVNTPKKVSSPIRFSTNRVSSPPRNNFGSTSGTMTSNNNNNSTIVESPRKTTTSGMSYDEEVFCNFLRDLIALENDVEAAKNDSALKSDFNMEDTFTVFEKAQRGYATDFDLKEGLNGYFGIFPLLEELAVVMKRYDTDRAGFLK